MDADRENQVIERFEARVNSINRPRAGDGGATVSADPKLREAVTRLAALAPLDYELVREAEAGKLHVRVGALDDAVKPTRGSVSNAQAVVFEPMEPWPEPVDGAALLEDLAASVQRYVVLPRHADIAVATWVVFTHMINAFNTAAMLALVSPEKRCGKSTLLGWVVRVAWRPLPTSNISPPAVFRSIEKWCPTLLVDEADTFLGDNEELRGVLNSGHTRDAAFVLRCVGEDFEPQRFQTFCPKVLAMIGKLPDTLQDRSIMVEMRRRLPVDKVDKLRDAEPGHFDELRRKIVRWAADHFEDMRRARPEIPKSLNDRAADNWEPLLAIAEAAGGKWPELARNAALALSGDADESDSIKTQLLSDIKTIFEKKDTDRLSSAAMVESLAAMEERPWPEFSHGKPITARQLAKLLKPFHIAPDTIRLESETLKGYLIDKFSDAFARYIPRSDPSHRHNPVVARVFEENSSVTQPIVLRIYKTLKPNAGAACDGVTSGKQEKGRAGKECAILRKRVAALAPDLVVGMPEVRP